MYDYIFERLAIERNNWAVFSHGINSERPWGPTHCDLTPQEWENIYKPWNKYGLHSQLDLSRVCHQTHTETSQLIIPKAVFYFTDPWAFAIFERTTIKDQALLIGTFYKSKIFIQAKNSFVVLDKFEGLKRILIDVINFDLYPCDEESVRAAVKVCMGGAQDVDIIFGGCKVPLGPRDCGFP